MIRLKNEKNIINNEDIDSLYRVIDLIKSFLDKNPIRKRKFQKEKYTSKLNKMRENLRVDQMKTSRNFFKLLRKLKALIRSEVIPDIFYIFGGHGGIIIDNIGFCEFDAPNYALDSLIEKMELAIKFNMPYDLEIATSCLEWLNNNNEKRFSDFLTMYQQGRFEILNPTYSQPYLLLIGEESNIKQFEFGFKVLNNIGLDCDIYYASESSLHPQLPQILGMFGVKYCSIRARIFGMNPTTHAGHINWMGLDNSIIPTLTDQSGIYNGEFWHGTFFQELPNLLFQAVSRPTLKYLIFSSIEDFIMPLNFQEDVWRLSRHADLFGKFILASEVFKQIENAGSFKFERDAFWLGELLFRSSQLYLSNKKCEVALITLEFLNVILSLYQDGLDDQSIERLWEKLMLTQAHDNYAVPNVRNGDYSEAQFPSEILERIKVSRERIAISKLSLNINEKILEDINNLKSTALTKLRKIFGVTKTLKNRTEMSYIIFNPAFFSRKGVVEIVNSLIPSPDLILVGTNGEQKDYDIDDSTLRFIANVPPLGYRVYTLKMNEKNQARLETEFLFTVRISRTRKSLEVYYEDNLFFKMDFSRKYSYELIITDEKVSKIRKISKIRGENEGKSFELEVIQYRDIPRIEFMLTATQVTEIIISPEFKYKKSFINYPFGIEETKRNSIQSLDFLLLRNEKRGLIYIQKNSQHFILDRKNNLIKNSIRGKGSFEFAIAPVNTQEFYKVYEIVKDYNFKLIGIPIEELKERFKTTNSFVSLEDPVILSNLWSRQGSYFIRLLNPSEKDVGTNLKGELSKRNFSLIDLKYNNLEALDSNKLILKPWEIKTFSF